MTVRRAALATLASALLALAAPRRAGAEDSAPERARAEALFDEAELAAAEHRYEDALAAYRRAMDADPTAPFAPAARVRGDDLAAHAEGDFAPLRRLDEVRRDPARLRDRVAIDALERDAAAFPPGRVRSEARLVVAEARWNQLGEPERALQPLEDLLADPAADRPSRALALNELVAVDRSLHRLDHAIAAAERFPDIAPLLHADLLRARRRDRLRPLAALTLLVLFTAGSISVARVAARRGVRAVPRLVIDARATGVSLFLGAGAALLARVYGTGDPRPFLWLGLGLFGLAAIVKALRLATSDSIALRALRGVASGAGVLAVAFFALDLPDARLDPMGTRVYVAAVALGAAAAVASASLARGV